jgi:membrane protein implicated in regulation of membrane protease activity
MMSDIINASTLNCVYFGLFLLGVGYAIFIVITGGLSDVDLPQIDVDVPQIDLPGDVTIGGPEVPVAGLDAPDVAVSPLSPITIASFITTFGGVGVLTLTVFGVDPRWSLLWATGIALVVAGVMFLFYSQFLIRSQASSEVKSSEIIGLEAEVMESIQPGKTGQVSYATKAGRMRSMARSVEETAIPRGELVRIVRVVGPIVIVEPLMPGQHAAHWDA